MLDRFPAFRKTDGMDELESIRALLSEPGAPAKVHAETHIAMSTLYRIRQEGMRPRYDTLQRLREYRERQTQTV